jgi:flagellar assembly protein FliH
MSSSSNPGKGFRNVPPPERPAGSKPQPSYARFIPREELGEVSSWQPGAFGRRATDKPGAQPPAGPAAPAAAPLSEEQQRERTAERHAARQAGYQDGYRDGTAALESFKQHFAAQAMAQVGALVEAFDAQQRTLDARIADALARTAVQIARQVVRSELAQRPELVVRVAEDALDAVVLTARHVTLRVHPQDLPLVAEGAQEALAARGARVAADETIERGGLLIDSEAGIVDARIATRWAQAAAELSSAREDLTFDAHEQGADAP